MRTFSNRTEAGRLLAEKLLKYRTPNTIVVGVARGGVEVAHPVASRLGVPLSVTVPRKIGAPGNPEVAIGALTEGGEAIWNTDYLRILGLNPADLDDLVERELKEIRHRLALYRSEELDYASSDVILIDDGVATGFTLRAAIEGIRAKKPNSLLLGLPVLARDAVSVLEPKVDRLVYLMAPVHFISVGAYYDDFEPTSDEVVIRLLNSTS